MAATASMQRCADGRDRQPSKCPCGGGPACIGNGVDPPCQRSAATSSRVAVRDSSMAFCPRKHNLPSTIRVIADWSTGSPQLMVAAATSRRLRPPIALFQITDITRIVEASPRIRGIDNGPDEAPASIGVQRLAGNGQRGGCFLGAERALTVADSGLIFHIDYLDQD